MKKKYTTPISEILSIQTAECLNWGLGGSGTMAQGQAPLRRDKVF